MRLHSVKDPAPSWSARQVLGIVGGAVVGIAMLIMLVDGANRHGTSPRAALDGLFATTAAPAASVDAVELWRDYDANEFRADEKYRDRLLLVSGEVQSIDSGPTGEARVHLRGPNEHLPTRAILEASERRRAAQVSRGERVRLRCRGAGRLVGRPLLRDCVLNGAAGPTPRM